MLKSENILELRSLRRHASGRAMASRAMAGFKVPVQQPGGQQQLEPHNLGEQLLLPPRLWAWGLGLPGATCSAATSNKVLSLQIQSFRRMFVYQTLPWELSGGKGSAS